MKYFAFLTFLIFASYLLGFIKKPEKYQWMDRNYTTAIKGFSILTVVWAHSGAMLSVGGIQFIAGIGVALFLMCSGYGLEISHEKNGLVGFWKKRLLGVCLPFWAVELIGLLATGTFSIKSYLFSTDGTETLCKELNAELQKIGSVLDFYQHKWVSYADQLNWGLQNTGIDTEWSMRMDADEEIMGDLAAEIDERLPKVKAPVNGIILRRRVYFMGRWIKHGGRYPELLLRIFRTGKASCEMKIMDEHMILSEGTTVEFKHDLIDNNQKDLEWWTAKHNWYSNREVLDHQMTLVNAMDESLEQDGTSSGQAKMKRVVKNSGYYRLPKF